jgi:hypothetical protein
MKRLEVALITHIEAILDLFTIIHNQEPENLRCLYLTPSIPIK